MTSFDGGWTLVRPDMVEREGRTNDQEPQSSSKVDVVRTIGEGGGAA